MGMEMPFFQNQLKMKQEENENFRNLLDIRLFVTYSSFVFQIFNEFEVWNVTQICITSRRRRQSSSFSFNYSWYLGYFYVIQVFIKT